MCYFLYLASPLTLSEVRSMLPIGLTADLASTADQRTLKSIHPTAATVARILAGRCSCDLVRQRLPESKEDERHLRERYRILKLPRNAIITSLDQHRERRHYVPSPPSGWPEALAVFVAEHARNAGPSLYLLHFGTPESLVIAEGEPQLLAAGQLTFDPAGWLREGRPALVR